MRKAYFAVGIFCLLFLFKTMTFADEVRYVTHIKALVDAKCIKCHGEGTPEYYAFKAEKEKWLSKNKGPRMDTYSHLIFYVGWLDTGAIMRRLDDGKNTKDGKPGNMYIYLGENEEERQRNLNQFKEWVGLWTHKRWNEITKEELNLIKVKY